MPDSATLATALLLTAAAALLVAAMFYPSAMLRWFQRKRYQYEVTFSLYMLTSTEKFIFSTPVPILQPSLSQHHTPPASHHYYTQGYKRSRGLVLTSPRLRTLPHS
jgi:hypothetical protein